MGQLTPSIFKSNKTVDKKDESYLENKFAPFFKNEIAKSFFNKEEISSMIENTGKYLDLVDGLEKTDGKV